MIKAIPHTADAAVHLGIHACQGPDGFGWHGLGRYARELTIALLRGHKELIGGIHCDYEHQVPRTAADFCGFSLIEQHKPGDSLESNPSPRAYHMMSPLWPVGPLDRMVPRRFLVGNHKLIVTLHDLIPLLYPKEYLYDARYREWFLTRLRVIEQADCIIAVSQATRIDAERVLNISGDRIAVVYEGVSDFFRESASGLESVRGELVSQLPGIADRYIVFCAGTAQYRKNLKGAIEGFALLPAQLRETTQLVVTGYLENWQLDDLLKFAASLGVRDQLLLPGFVSDELLRQLYQACALCIFPSLYEGFGLPILEAMKCGAPVATSDRSSMRELVEMPEALFNPEQPSDMAQTMANLLTNETLHSKVREYGRKRAKQFTWEKAASETAEVYRDVLAVSPHISRPTRTSRTVLAPRVKDPARRETVQQNGSPKVYLSLRGLQGPRWTRHRGWVRYVYDHALKLLEDHRELIAGLHIGAEAPLPKRLAEFCGQGLMHQSVKSVGTLPAGKSAEVFHIMSVIFPEGSVPVSEAFPVEFSRSKTKLAVTLHDLIPLRFDYEFPPDPRYRAEYGASLKLVQQADMVMTNSKATASDAIELLGIDPARVRVIYGGVSSCFGPPSESAAQLRMRVQQRFPEIRGPYVLSMLYGMGSRKNMEGLIDGFSKLCALPVGHQLVLVGHDTGDDNMRELHERARAAGIDDRLVFTGVIEDEVLVLLYQDCDLFIYASLYEGLGLPIIEAMACGAPTVISDRPAMNELVETEKARFDPEDAGDIARVMARPLTDEGFRTELKEYGIKRAKRFSWDRVAKETADCYRELVGPNDGRLAGASESMRHVAFSAPSAESEDRSYVWKVVAEVCDRYPLKVDVVTDGRTELPVAIEPRNLTFVSHGQFLWSARRGHYDNILYSMGNDLSYETSYELLKQQRGAVWLQDIRLTDFYRARYTRQGHDLHRLPHELRQWTTRYPHPDGDLLLWDLNQQHEYGVFLTNEVVAHAENILVNSTFSAELVRLDAGRDVPITTLPLATCLPDSSSNEPPSSARDTTNRRVIVSLGPMGPIACGETIIDAFVEIASRHGDARLVFTAPWERGYRSILERRIRALELSERVTLLDAASEGEVSRLLSEAECAVQLHYPTSGQFPFQAIRCLANGVPTIVSDHGPLRDLPEDAAMRVPAAVEASRLASAMESLLSDSNVRQQLARNGKKYASSATLSNVADRLWMHLCNRRSG